MTADSIGCTCYDETTRKCPLPGHPQQALPPDPAAEAESELLAAVEVMCSEMELVGQGLAANNLRDAVCRYQAAKGREYGVANVARSE